MIIDLTLSISENLIDDYLKKQENKILAQGHIGTHLDIYNKSDIPLEYFRRRGVLIDASETAEYREVGMENILELNINKGDFVVIRTGRIEKYNYGTNDYFKNHPIISNELLEYLITKKISFIGIDTAGIRKNGLEHQQADKYCEDNGVYVIENMTNLDKLVGTNFDIYTMWLEDKSATGLRTRVIAEIK